MTLLVRYDSNYSESPCENCIDDKVLNVDSSREMEKEVLRKDLLRLCLSSAKATSETS